MKKALFGLMLIGAFGLGFAAFRLFGPESTPPQIEGLLWPPPTQLAEFSLTDHQGETFDLARVRGHWTLWFFGYTHCPDVCPQTLSVMSAIEEELTKAQALDGVQFVFVSVDSKRDTPEHVAKYVAYFSDSMIGVSADPERLPALTSQLGVFYKLHAPDANGDYLVDHSSAIFLTDPAGRLVGLFRPPQQAREIAPRLLAIREALGD